MKQNFKTLLVFGFFLFFLSSSSLVHSAEVDFQVDPSYDYAGRSKVSAFLNQIGVNAYFYVESEYYNNLDIDQKKEFIDNVRNLSQEFDNNIYPKLRELFGSEWNPGIDKDPKITILLARIKGDSGGYFNSGDEYPKIQSADSNEREMLYLNANYISSPLAKGFLAHEFTHLITFNQKEKTRGIEEDIWLNEARAEMAIAFLGYDAEYQGSNLQRRVKAFLQNTSDPLGEWKNESSDYGVANIFTRYLVERYGITILSDSLKSGKAGIPSLEEALKNRGFAEDFPQIFSDWSISVLLNDCFVSLKYCYLNENLKNLRIIPQLNYLPSAGESTLTLLNYAKSWQGNWYKFIGGQGTLKLNFVGDQKVKFRVPYVSEDSSGKYAVGFLELSAGQSATNYFSEFGKKIKSIILIPSIQSKMSGFGEVDPYYQFIITASIINENPEKKEQEELIKGLLAQIELLQKEIAAVQAKIVAILAAKGKTPTTNCGFENDLYYGMEEDANVRCLQEFLKKQGPEIYPEGLVTGNFFSATKKAVIRFQEKYALEILVPAGLKKGTGYVGQRTRAKINQLISRI